jgi:hypothetical protein
MDNPKISMKHPCSITGCDGLGRKFGRWENQVVLCPKHITVMRNIVARWTKGGRVIRKHEKKKQLQFKAPVVRKPRKEKFDKLFEINIW